MFFLPCHKKLHIFQSRVYPDRYYKSLQMSVSLGDSQTGTTKVYNCLCLSWGLPDRYYKSLQLSLSLLGTPRQVLQKSTNVCLSWGLPDRYHNSLQMCVSLGDSQTGTTKVYNCLQLSVSLLGTPRQVLQKSTIVSVSLGDSQTGTTKVYNCLCLSWGHPDRYYKSLQLSLSLLGSPRQVLQKSTIVCVSLGVSQTGTTKVYNCLCLSWKLPDRYYKSLQLSVSLLETPRQVLQKSTIVSVSLGNSRTGTTKVYNCLCLSWGLPDRYYKSLQLSLSLLGTPRQVLQKSTIVCLCLSWKLPDRYYKSLQLSVSLLGTPRQVLQKSTIVCVSLGDSQTGTTKVYNCICLSWGLPDRYYKSLQLSLSLLGTPRQVLQKSTIVCLCLSWKLPDRYYKSLQLSVSLLGTPRQVLQKSTIVCVSLGDSQTGTRKVYNCLCLSWELPDRYYKSLQLSLSLLETPRQVLQKSTIVSVSLGDSQTGTIKVYNCICLSWGLPDRYCKCPNVYNIVSVSLGDSQTGITKVYNCLCLSWELPDRYYKRLQLSLFLLGTPRQVLQKSTIVSESLGVSQTATM